MPTPITDPTVIDANSDASLSGEFRQDIVRIETSPNNSVILVTDKSVYFNTFEQTFTQEYITAITEVNNPAGQEGEVQIRQGDNFGAIPNFAFNSGSNVLRVPGIATDNLRYANGAPWVFGPGGGVAYSNVNVLDFLANGTDGTYSLGNIFTTNGTITTGGNVQALRVRTDNLQYANGQPWVFSVYNDSNVIALLNSGTVANVNIADTILVDDVVSYGTLYVRPSDSARLNVDGNIPAILPGQPSELANVNLQYNIGAATGRFKNIYLGNADLSSNLTVSGTATITGNVSISNNITAVGNISTARNVDGYTMTVGSNLTVANVITVNTITANSAAFSLGATASNLTVTGNLSVTGAANSFVNLQAANVQVIGNLRGLSNSNIFITGGTIGQFLQTDGNGNLSWQTIATAGVSNGNSNVTVAANGNISFGVSGNANVFVVTGTGITATGNVNFSNAVINLGAVSNVRITGGSPNSILSTNGAGVLSWVRNPAVSYYEGNTGTANFIATTSEVNQSLPAGSQPRSGDIFVDIRGSANNQQPVYLYTNGIWRQILTATAGL